MTENVTCSSRKITQFLFLSEISLTNFLVFEKLTNHVYDLQMYIDSEVILTDLRGTHFLPCAMLLHKLSKTN